MLQYGALEALFRLRFVLVSLLADDQRFPGRNVSQN
jgi:hypothetical protein